MFQIGDVKKLNSWSQWVLFTGYAERTKSFKALEEASHPVVLSRYAVIDKHTE